MKEGQVFYIKLGDSDFASGQLLKENKKSVICLTVALFAYRASTVQELESLGYHEEDCFSTILVTSDIFDYNWNQEGTVKKMSISKKNYPFRKELLKDGVGVKMVNPKVLLDFVQAYFGLLPWDYYHDPLYFDKLLLDQSRKPNNLIYKGK